MNTLAFLLLERHTGLLHPGVSGPASRDAGSSSGRGLEVSRQLPARVQILADGEIRRTRRTPFAFG